MSEVVFLVKRRTIAFKQCIDCSGSGKKTKTFQKEKFVSNCFRCSGTGREMIIHETDCSLLDALKELNLIK